MTTEHKPQKKVQAALDAASAEGWEGGSCCDMAQDIIDAQDALVTSLEEQLEAMRKVAADAVGAYIVDAGADPDSSLVTEWCQALGETRAELEARYWDDGYPEIAENIRASDPAKERDADVSR